MTLSPRARRACRRIFLFALAAALVLSTTQCLNHPRNGQTSPSKSTVVAFDGYIQQANTAVSVFVFNTSTTNFDPVAHAPIVSATSGYTDHAGVVWYAFSATDVLLPSASQYWVAGAGRSNAAKVRVVVSGGGDLGTFDVDADTCMDTQLETSGGVAVFTNCHSNETPTAIVNATCGAAGGDCCIGAPQCDYGNNCSGTSCSAACGAHGQKCCGAVPGCDADDACTSGTCQCGGNGMPCCAGGANTGCNSGYVCENNRCSPCGGIYGICCHNGTCNGGTCVDSTPPQCACGGLGQACCSGNYCPNGNQCNGGVCAAPQKAPPTCVGVGGACGTSTGPYCCSGKEVCNYGTCLACTPHGSACANSPNPCCSWQDICVIDQETGGSQCDIGDSSPAN